MKRWKIRQSSLLSINLLVAMGAVWPHSGGAMDIVVANNADSGNGTLRQAIQFNESLGGGNTIVFSNTVTGTISLTNPLGELFATKDVTITGPGAKSLAISGNNAHRVFHLTNNVTVSISGLTITGGSLNSSLRSDGAGILQDSGTLTLSDCAIANNHNLSGYGGGISASGALTAIRCAFYGNLDTGFYGGGGIYTIGALTAINCTFSGNHSVNVGGGITQLGGTLALTNCTLTGNTAFSPGGGGIYLATGTATIRNCIIASNTASTAPDCVGAFTSAGFNLIGAVNGSTGWGALGDQLGTTNSYLNPMLGPLQDNGGLTPTLAPLIGSPVVDQGNSGGITTDQRGRSRPYTQNPPVSIPLGGDHSDIGAVELQSPVIYEWTFNRNDLSATLGPGLLTCADAATPGLTSFGTTDGSTVPHIGGQPAAYMHVPGFVGLTNGYLVELTASDPNGGGQFINQYTFIVDVLVPGTVNNYLPFFNTNPQNGNDADFYMAPNGSVGIQVYSSPGLITSNIWYRIAFVADLTTSKLTYFVNGLAVGTNNTPSLDGRWSLASEVNPGADLLLFNEGDLSGVYTHEVYVAHVAVVDRSLSASEIASLGTPAAEGIFVQRLSVNRSGSTVVLNWRGTANVALQKATNLTTSNWQTIGATLGANTYNETATSAAFYRLTGP